MHKKILTLLAVIFFSLQAVPAHAQYQPENLDEIREQVQKCAQQCMQEVQNLLRKINGKLKVSDRAHTEMLLSYSVTPLPGAAHSGFRYMDAKKQYEKNQQKTSVVNPNTGKRTKAAGSQTTQTTSSKKGNGGKAKK